MMDIEEAAQRLRRTYLIGSYVDDGRIPAWDLVSEVERERWRAVAKDAKRLTEEGEA